MPSPTTAPRVSQSSCWSLLNAAHLALVFVVTTASLCSSIGAQLNISNTFTTPSGVVSLGFSDSTDLLWAYSSFGSSIASYTRGGTPKGTIPRGGEAANDVDVDVASVALTLGTTAIPAGTLLFINGESGFADIYAIDPSTGTLLASLTTSFGASHVVGGSYHPGRGTFFLVQDRVPPATASKNLIAEIDPVSGAIISSFQIASPFTVNYGDIDVDAISGNLFVVSSDESDIRELTPSGVLVKDHALPFGVSNLNGIAIDEGRGTIWVSSGNKVWELGGLPSPSVSVYGTPTAGSLIYSWLVPPPGGLPRIGNAGFSVQVNTPGMASPGVVLLSARPADIQVIGIRILVDLNLSFTIPTQAPVGSALALPIPATLVPGTQLYLQSFHFDAGAPSGIASTAGLQLTLFP